MMPVAASKISQDSDQVAFVLEHLQGDAKREILYRPKFVNNSPDRIFEALIEVFQLVDSLPRDILSTQARGGRISV